jgi:hypothetical protein
VVLTNVSDRELVTRVEALCAEGNRLLARLIEHLIELDERRVHLKRACPSLFEFCVRRLGMSEGAAFRRVTAARLVSKFPSLLGRIERGELHLSSLVLLRDYVTAANVDELADAVSRRSKREVEELLAHRAPRPDVPGRLRKLPGARTMRTGAPAAAREELSPGKVGAGLFAAGSAVTTAPEGPPPAAAASASGGPASAGAAGDAPPLTTEGRAAASSPVHREARARVEPRSEARHRLQLTISTTAREKLERARELMRHRNPSGDLEVLFEHALDALLDKLERERLAKTSRPAQAPRSPRCEPAAGVKRSTRREVFARDGERCTYVSEEGRRCSSRACLELDHIESRALGGSNEASNLRVMCRPHNMLHAENVFGRELIRVRTHFRQRRGAGGGTAELSVPAREEARHEPAPQGRSAAHQTNDADRADTS